jgi:hypothetical protein
MKMAVERLSALVAHTARRRGARCATRTGRRIRLKIHHRRSYTSPSLDRKVIVCVPARVRPLPISYRRDGKVSEAMVTPRDLIPD